MLLIKDITEVKSIEETNHKNSLYIKKLTEIFSAGVIKYKKFLSSSYNLIQEIESMISTEENGEIISEDYLKYIHTIKGNARIYKFDLISEAVHSLENNYLNATSSNAMKDLKGKISSDLRKIFDQLKEYEVKFNESVSRIIDDEKKGPSVNYLPLSKMNLDYINDISSSLGKASPKINIKDYDIKISSSCTEFICNIFGHLLRILIDHGIEDPESRLTKGKEINGEINIILMEIDSQIEIEVHDDGKGIDIDALRRLYRVSEKIEDWQVANMIFATGTSTAKGLSKISGRGDGYGCYKRIY